MHYAAVTMGVGLVNKCDDSEKVIQNMSLSPSSIIWYHTGQRAVSYVAGKPTVNVAESNAEFMTVDERN